MGVRQVGATGLLVQCRDGAEVEGWRRLLAGWRESGELVAREIVPGARTVLLDGLADPAGVAARLAALPPPEPVAAADPAEAVRVPVVFDGADLAEVAAGWEVPGRVVVERLCGVTLRSAFCGFAPGFAYLSGMPAGWRVSRRATPRPRVPAGAVGLADTYVGIYPTASPGGWRLVGHTDTALFDVDADPPALLSPGTSVRLVEA